MSRETGLEKQGRSPDWPRVTIGITCFNAQDTIGRCIESAMQQTWAALEILVVDDCSTDGSVTEIRRWQTRDGRVRLVEHEVNTGAGAARQTLLEECTGEYIVFFDDDDVSDPRRAEVQLGYLQDARAGNGERPVLCYASGQRVYGNGYVKNLPAIGSEGAPVCGDALAAYLLANERVTGHHYGAGTPACALMVAREDASRIGGFDPVFRRVEDLDFAVRVAVHGGCAIGTRETLFTQYATQGSDKSAYANYEAELRLIDKHRAFLEARGQYGAARRWFGVRYRYFAGRWPAFVGAALVALAANPVRVGRRLLGNAPARVLHDFRRRAGTGS